MILKTDILSGTALDYAVAISSGATNFRFDTVATFWLTLDGKDIALSKGWSRQQSYYPSSNWAQGGLIIEREGIDLFTVQRDLGIWSAETSHNQRFIQKNGSSALVAAMRCFVATRLGNEIDVPQCLLNATPQRKSL